MNELEIKPETKMNCASQVIIWFLSQLKRNKDTVGMYLFLLVGSSHKANIIISGELNHFFQRIIFSILW